jgi:nucleoside 2-deoxyribosyltransferase
MKIYLAAPLLNPMERSTNYIIRDKLVALGHQVYLPQEAAGLAFKEIDLGGDAKTIRQRIFDADMTAIRDTEVLLAVLDGRVPDEGVCVEVGVAYALGKKCVGYKTDARSLDKYGDNLFLEGCLTNIIHSEEELETIFAEK